ncbi:MAG: hypothetical protein ACHQ51_05455 [Elusimicrobiota bacterium]
MSHLLRPRATKKVVSMLLSPLILLSSFLGAAPARAQFVEAAPRTVPSAMGTVPAALGSAPAALTAPSFSLSAAALAPAAAPGVVSAAPVAAPAAALAPALTALPAPAPLAAAVAPARTSAAPAAKSDSSPRTIVGQLAQAVTSGFARSIERFFDGGLERAPESAPAYARGILTAPQAEHRLQPGVRLDAKPRPSDAGSVRVNDFHTSPSQKLPNGASPIKLNANASDPAAVEAALRALVDSDPAKYGAASSDMAKVHVQFVPGDKSQGQADTYYAIFRQWKKGTEKDGSPYYLLVDGGSLTFVLKVFSDGKPTVMATEGRLYPGISSDILTVNYDDGQMQAIAAKRMQSPPDAAPSALRKFLSRIWERVVQGAKKTVPSAQPPQFLTRTITQMNGAWRAMNVYEAADLEGRPVIVAVDVKSGEAFAWSAQQLLRDGGPIASGIGGAAMARGTDLNTTGSDHGPTTALPLPFANVYDASGKVVATTAADGTFTVPGSASGPVQLTIKLNGRYADTTDADAAKNGDVSVTLTATPGQAVKATLNPDGSNPELEAEVNGYIYYSKQVDWLKNSAGVTDERILAPLGGGVKANKHDMPGNAYYSPADDSLNLQAAATVTFKDKLGRPHTMSFENTAQPSIIYHESTHRAVQILSQIALTAEQSADAAYRFVRFVMEPVMNSGVNEAIADTVSMFIRGNPLIGEGFFVTPPAGKPNLIRTGENTTQFDPQNPDPHAQGEAYMGFTWTVRQALVSALGEAAGAAYAALLVVPTTLYSQPQDVPTAMLHVLISDMKTDGTIPHEALIRAAAEAHGPAIAPVTSPR